MFPNTNILQRTFLIRRGVSTGTGFAIEWNGREYFITAKHVIQKGNGPIDILHDEQWKPLPVTGIYCHPGKPDTAMTTLGQQIAPRHPVELTTAGTIVGQDTLIVGFPFGWSNTVYDLNNGFPMPFVKSALLSAFVFKHNTTVTYLDGHNNPGFSGGPIVTDHIPRKDPQLGPKIIGIVSGFEPENTPHPSEIDPPPKHMAGYPLADDHVHLTNSGFILGYGINHAIEIIEANPTGFKLPA